MPDLKTEIRKAANAQGVTESAADLIADHMAENGFEVTHNEELAAQNAKKKSELRVQPAAAASGEVKPAAGSTKK